MMKVKPIEGNGWYAFDKRIEPPPPFLVEITSEISNDHCVGIVRDPSSKFDGYHFRGHQRYHADEKILNVQMDRAEFLSSYKQEPDVSGYVEIVV